MLTLRFLRKKYIKKLNKNKKLKSLILRFGTIVGFSYGMRFHTAVNKFCYQASVGLPLSVWKTSMNQKRPYLGLTDACRSIEFFLKQKNFDGQTYNVLSKNLSVKDIIQNY
jgi:nucleoside-diphosphate-sugar epimerase